MRELSRRAFLFGAAAVPLVAALPAPVRAITLSDRRAMIAVDETFTISGVVNPVTGALQTFRVIASTSNTLSLAHG